MTESQLATTLAEGGPSQLEKGIGGPKTSSVAADVTIVSWDNLNSSENPMHWTRKRKWFITILTSLGGLVTLMTGAMLAPALEVIGKDLNITQAEASLALSIYILAFSFGPMLIAPCSEVFGRKPIWIVGSAWYILWNIVCGFSKNRGLLIVGRLMSGLGASAEFAVSGPIVADCWSADERGKSLAIRQLIPLLGPALGPIIGGVMVQQVSWRWLFFVLSIFDAILLILFILFLPETHAQTILSRKATALRKSTGDQYFTQDDLLSPTLAHRLKLGLLRPTRLLVTQPVVQLVSLILAYQFGLNYLALSTFSFLWTDRYKQSPTISGLHYLSFATGCTIASQVGGWATDRIWARLKEKNQGQSRPENRLWVGLPAVVLIPVGLLWYGWSAERRLYWIMPDIGIAIFASGFMSGSQAAQAYIIDAFVDHTASAGAASQLLRNVFAFVFPIFGPSLYASLGYGYGNTVLAAVAIGIGLPALYTLWKYGEKLRAKGKTLR